jgi:aryl-alcohol dehydrogenase-like predicted oxidoreductase
MTFGREADGQTSHKMVKAFLDAGGNFLDTANVYSHGTSEEITGRAVKGLRDDLVIATKVRLRMGDAVNDIGVSRRHVMQAVNASLGRLGTDYIDVYQVHVWDDVTPVEETLSVLSGLVHEGKVRYIGVSNFTAWQICKAVHTSETHGFERFISLQPQYSLVERNIEYEVVPACLEAGLGLIPWGPLGQGWLTGKYKKGEPPPEGSRITDAKEGLEEHWSRRATDRNWAIVEELGSISQETGKSYSQVALNWLLRKPGVVAPIVGATKLEQLQDNLGASGWELDPEHVHRLDKVSALEPIYPYHFISHAPR